MVVADKQASEKDRKGVRVHTAKQSLNIHKSYLMKDEQVLKLWLEETENFRKAK